MNDPLGGSLKTEDFILKNLPPKMFPSIRELQDHADFWMSDHSRFWYHKEENDFMTFPSILLTDTGRAYSGQHVTKESTENLSSQLKVL